MRQSLQRKLASLESEYRLLLKAALTQCASGRWGLFGHNDGAISQLGRSASDRLVTAEVRQLLELGGEIEALRRKLGFAETFALHARLMEMRASVDANSPGEPRLAAQWLMEFGSEPMTSAPDRHGMDS